MRGWELLCTEDYCRSRIRYGVSVGKVYYVRRCDEIRDHSCQS